MIILGKIKVDDQVLKYCEISYDPFYVTVMSEDEKAIVDLFNNAKSIIVMDQYIIKKFMIIFLIHTQNTNVC